jgi:aminopeptidase N
MLKKGFSLILILFSYGGLLSAQTSSVCHEPDPRAHAREHNIDISHMLLEVSFEPKQGLVKGTVTHTFRTLQKKIDSIYLDAIDTRFQQVTIDGKEVKYKNTGSAIIIYPASAPAWQSEHKLRIKYECNPKRGIYFIGWNDSTGRSRKQIWTQGEGIDNRHWIPSFDDPADKLITEVKVYMAEKYSVLSNGQKIADVKQKDGTHFWHYRISHPHALYLTMLGIGEYKVKATHSKSGVHIYEWYYPDQEDRLEPTYRYTERIMDILEKETGNPYPWESYSQIPVQDFLYGAMENTTATIFGDFFCVDNRAYLDRNYVAVNAHEMAHQWFGDLVTCRSWSNMWLQESFATFYSKQVDKELFGEDYYQWLHRGEANAALNASKDNMLPIAHSSPGTARHYQKGSFVLDMLRDVVGPDEFRKVIQYYLKAHAYSNVTSYDFEVAFHDVLGQNMDWFFDEWIYRGGEPFYQVSYQNLQGNAGRFTQVSIEQIHQQNDLVGLFKMPITVDVYYKDGTKSSQTEWVSEKNHVMNIANSTNKEIAFVLFDPGSRILKQVTFKKSFEELKEQALHAADMIDRYDAVLAMREMSLEKKGAFLADLAKQDLYHPIMGEVLYQLADYDRGADIFTRQAKSKYQQVRLAAINNAVNNKTLTAQNLAEFEKLLTDSSYNVVQATLLKLSSLYPENKQRYLQATDGVDGMGKSVRIAWLQLAITDVNDKYYAELADYTTNAFEFRTRINSFTALQTVNMLNEKAINGLFDAALSNNGRLASPARETIAYFARQSKYKFMMQQTLAKRNPVSEGQKTLSKLLE